MGGYGSGGWNGTGRPTIEECFPLSVKDLRRFDLLKPGHSAKLQWNGGAIWVQTWYDDALRLSWRRLDDGRDYSQLIGFQWLAHPRHFGGFQTYLVCPTCFEPSGAVYFYGNRFACRCCNRLNYASQRERQLKWV